MKKQVGIGKCFWVLSVIAAYKLILANTALAQTPFPVPDGTLGPESSVVEFVDESTRQVNGGAPRGGNLFHSFLEFNIGDERQVYFSNPVDIENIFSRITGNNSSNILGTLGVDGPANLFLLNPNGILFGPDANLDIQGALVTTTADAVQLGELGSFSVTEPENSVLLAVQPSALFFSQLAAQPTSSIRFEGESSLNPNQTLFVVGDDITFDSGRLEAPDGQVELVGVAAGQVGLNFDNGSLNLNLPDALSRSDVTLTNQSQLNVQGTGLGRIGVFAEDVEISGASQLRAGIASTPAAPAASSGNIVVDASGDIVLDGATFTDQGWNRSAISNTVAAGMVGNAGDIEVAARSLEVTQGAEINTSVRGQGTAGDITIDVAESVDLISGEVQSGRFASSRIRSGVEGSATNAQGGYLSITADSLSVTDGAFITASSNGQGNAGTVSLNAQNIAFIGDGLDVASGAYSQVFGSNGNGQAGDINIQASSLTLEDGGILVVNNSSAEPGELRNAGNITIDAARVLFSGENNLDNPLRHSGAYSRIEEGGVGNSGNITVNADLLQIENGALATVSANGQGNAGTIQVEAPEISLSGRGVLASGLYGRVRFAGIGQGGNVVIDTTNLEVRDGAVINTNTLNDGDAGRIAIDAENVTLIGIDESRNSSNRDSGLLSLVEGNGNGQGGEVIVNTHTLSVLEGADINTGILGGGEAGNININASGPVVLRTGSIDSRLEGSGRAVRAGQISITAESLDIVERSGISTSAFGSETESTGNITIDTRDYVFISGPGGGIFSQIGADPAGTRTDSEGNSGSISIRTGRLELRGNGEPNDRATITTRATRGNAGEIRIEAPDIVLTDQGIIRSDFAGQGEGRGGDINLIAGTLSMSTEALVRTNHFGVLAEGSQDGEVPDANRAGNVNIQANQLFLNSNASIESDTTGAGRAGNINLNVSGPISLVGGAAAPTGESTRITLGVQENATGDGGNLVVQAGSFTLADGAIVKTSTQGRGAAGNITIGADRVDISGSVPTNGLPSGLFATTGTAFAAGDMTINANSFRLSDGAALSTRTLGPGTGGTIAVNSQTFEAINGGQLVTTTSNTGQAGDIIVNADRIVLSGRDPNYRDRIARMPNPASRLVANNITETGPSSGFFASTLESPLPSGATATSQNTLIEGDGGNIEITSSTAEINSGAALSSTATSDGRAGNIGLTIDENLTLRNGTIETRSRSTTGGNIAITAERVSLFGNSDIETLIGQSGGQGGDITIEAKAILAFDDSDILAFAQGGQGGNITLRTEAFFGENYRPSPEGIDPFSLDGNNRVDINASGAVAGVITIPDVSFIENSLTELPETVVDTEQLIAGSCIARTEEGGSFIVSGSGGLPDRPGDAFLPPYATGEIRALPDGESDGAVPEAEDILEPQGVFQLSDGRIVISRLCAAESSDQR